MRMFKVFTFMNQYHKYSINIFNKEIALIQWNPNALTRLHDHKGKRCLFYVLNGPLKEYFYTKKNPTCDYTEHNYESFSKGYIDDTLGLHQIENPDTKTKYSIHCYY